MRMASVDRVEPSFVHDMLEATRFQGDEDYFATLAAARARHGEMDRRPRRAVPPAGLLSGERPAAHPAGRRRRDHPPRADPRRARGRRRLPLRLRRRCADHREWRDRRRAPRHRRDAARRCRRARLRRLPGQRRDDARAFRRRRRRRAAARAARAFQLRRRHPHGAGARRRFVRRAGRHAHRAGRSALARTRRRSCCSIPTASWWTATGRRFFDEGAGLVHETWEAFSRRLHFEVPGRTAYAILDARVRAIPDWQRATRSEVPPFEAATLAELAKLIGVDADNLARDGCGLQRRLHRRPAKVRRHRLRRPRGVARRSRRRNPTGRAPSPSRRSSPGR